MSNETPEQHAALLARFVAIEHLVQGAASLPLRDYVPVGLEGDTPLVCCTNFGGAVTLDGRRSPMLVYPKLHRCQGSERLLTAFTGWDADVFVVWALSLTGAVRRMHELCQYQELILQANFPHR